MGLGLGLDDFNLNSSRIVSGSTVDPNNDPNKKESFITLMDARQSLDPLPIQRIKLDMVHDVKRYIRVKIKEVWGGNSGKIDYFDIERKWQNKIFNEKGGFGGSSTWKKRYLTGCLHKDTHEDNKNESGDLTIY